MRDRQVETETGFVSQDNDGIYSLSLPYFSSQQLAAMGLAYNVLSDDEIEKFAKTIDSNKDGNITLQELERRLEDVHTELVKDPQAHHLFHASRRGNEKPSQTEKGESGIRNDDLHDFLCRLMPGNTDGVISRAQFCEFIKRLNIPSQDQTKDENEDAAEYDKKMPLRRRIRAYWAVRGPEYIFLAFVVGLTIGFSLWQGLKYVRDPVARSTLGWGVITAKFSAGAVYPLFFFLILSMSRWAATIVRKSYVISRFVNVDFGQAFHIRISIAALFFSCLHVVGHLTGTFVFGSSSSRQDQVEALFGVRKNYADYVQSRPGWSGLTAISSFLIIAITSTPWVRRRSYEIFQSAHLLMYLMFAMLALHGTAALLQAPMFGYWLVLPVLCVLFERLHRLVRGFLPYTATIEQLDDGTVVITAEKARDKKWPVRAGQYILLQVPELSRWQWHPFTVSACVGNRLQVHVKADGDFTNKLHELAGTLEKDGQPGKIKVGIDGAFGAPAQRFYTYDKAIIIGAGIGVTPFSAVLTDLEENYKAQGDPWKLTRTRSFPGRKRNLARVVSNTSSTTRVNEASRTNSQSDAILPMNELRQHKAGSYNIRRVDFIWTVRERNDLSWFSELLNRASAMAEADGTNLTLNVDAYVTAKRKDLSQHIFRFLLDAYRTESHPVSALTGLRTAAHFERPDFDQILENFYLDMKAQEWPGRCAVFFCGSPVIGEMLADKCALLTARARSEGSSLRMIFHNEVFN